MKTVLSLSLFLACAVISTSSNAQQLVKKDLAHTFSIVARDTATGEMAVGVQSH
jgi:hypothetical protein